MFWLQGMLIILGVFLMFVILFKVNLFLIKIFVFRKYDTQLWSFSKKYWRANLRWQAYFNPGRPVLAFFLSIMIVLASVMYIFPVSDHQFLLLPKDSHKSWTTDKPHNTTAS